MGGSERAREGVSQREMSEQRRDWVRGRSLANLGGSKSGGGERASEGVSQGMCSSQVGSGSVEESSKPGRE